LRSMKTWLDEPIRLERERREAIEAFTAAAVPFMEKLRIKLGEDIDTFTSAFPATTISMQPQKATRIDVINMGAGNPLPSVAVSANPISHTLHVAFSGIGPYALGLPLEILDGEASLAAFRGNPLALTAISGFILYPVLFPNLPHDPTAYRAP
jgi:hypothetical protein